MPTARAGGSDARVGLGPVASPRYLAACGKAPHSAAKDAIAEPWSQASHLPTLPCGLILRCL